MSAARVFVCPMHSHVHANDGGKCPECNMELMPAGTRFALARHILGNWRHIAIMAAVMIVGMAAFMMMRGAS